MTLYRSALSLAMLGFVLVASACATSSLDRMFAADQYLEIARTFEADSTLHGQERALYLAGIAYALPESPAYAPERAMQILDRLISLYPDGEHALHARHLQQLHRELRRTGDAQALQEREVAVREASLAAMRDEVAALEEELAGERARAERLQADVDRLNGEIQRGNALIEAIEAELEALKGIDLNRPRP